MPPPPAAALTIMGKPNSQALVMASASLKRVLRCPASPGSPDLRATRRAESLSPIWFSTSSLGPMNTMPSDLQRLRPVGCSRTGTRSRGGWPAAPVAWQASHHGVNVEVGLRGGSGGPMQTAWSANCVCRAPRRRLRNKRRRWQTPRLLTGSDDAGGDFPPVGNEHLMLNIAVPRYVRPVGANNYSPLTPSSSTG